MGQFHLADSLPATLKCLQSRGVHVYGADNYNCTSTAVNSARHGAKPVAPHMPAGGCEWALVVGSEAGILSQEVVAVCNDCVCVPQRQGESLNVAHTTAI